MIILKLEKIKKKIIEEEVETFRKLNLKLNVNEEDFFDELYGKVIERTIKLTAKEIFEDIEEMRKGIWNRSEEVGWKFCAVYDGTLKDVQLMLQKEWGVEDG